ncbi:piggyBac transposable element-derived protein 4-like [Stylophora pistillata]|uniref:piggyBac transposable element-derived protein 4-like n=1 Tax=Stylophora pistillata TaxID=50429 RepID=UPI000C03E24E|nr:piggyBac transposable element-derived protein 4-like [Stylophora pistillata]
MVHWLFLLCIFYGAFNFMQVKKRALQRRVCDLCHPTLDNRGPVIYMDNCFSSIALSKTLKGFGIYTLGTLRSNRLGYPKCLTDKPLLKTLKRGDYHSATAEGITVTVWKDTKDVSFLSNVHSSTGQDNVSRKKQGGSVVAITAPPVVKDYNKNMGAIDKNDQLKKTYAIDRKSKKWWMRIFFHLLDICRLNSLMYQQCYLSWNSGPVEEDVAPLMDQKSFTSKLVESLCGTYTSHKLYGRPSLSPSSISLRALGHESVNVVKCGKLKRGRCCECSTDTHKKRARVETVYGCLHCNVSLCCDKCHDL